MSCRCDVRPWIAGACLVGNTGLGVLGSTVPAVGTDGGAFGFEDLEAADLTAEVRWLVIRWPSAGTLVVNEDSSFSFTGAPPGRYFFDVEGFVDGALRGRKRVLLLVGPQPDLIEQLQAVLDPLAAGGAWYQMNEAQPPVWPFIVYQVVVSPLNVGLRGASNLQNTRVQIDIHSRTIADARTVEVALEAAMAAWTVTNSPVSDLNLFEDATRSHRVVKDYSIWAWTG